MEIKGRYEVSILIQNMFNSYMIIDKNSNLVTDSGLTLLLQLIAGKTSRSLGYVHVGTNEDEASYYDTPSTFVDALALPHSSIEIDGNIMTYTINTVGANIKDTSEIGIWSDDGDVLVTRDVHIPYDVPDSAIITIKYSLELSNKEEEDTND